MPRPKALCHGCRRQFGRIAGADLYCSNACKANHEKRETDTAAALKAEGFIPDANNPKQFTKEGVSISLSYATKYPIARVLADHTAAVQYHSRTGAMGTTPGGK